MVDLRPYQDDFVAGIRAAFARSRRVLGVAPTGSGKTVTFSYITQHAAAKGNSVILCAHRTEIVDQISRSLDAFGVRHGRIQAGRAMATANCHVAMVQTLANRVDKIPPPKLLVVDEAHHAVSNTYSKLLAAWPEARVLGVTATPERLDGRGLGEWFDEIVIGPTPAALIADGHLARFKYLAPPNKLDLSGVSTRAGDFSVEAIAAAVEKAKIVGDAIQHYRDHIDGRPAIAFCVTVAHAEAVAADFVAAGYRAASVDGKMSPADRAARIAGIGNGDLQVLTSCELISEGVDVPVVAGAILLRPTQSLGMHLQQVGRVLRVKPDGSRAVILDHVGNVHRHGLPDAEREWSLASKKRKPGTAKTVTCDVCYRVFDSAASDWRAVAKCELDCPEDCALTAISEEAAERALPQHEDGTLIEMSMTPEWAAGLAINDQAIPLRWLLPMAQTEAQLLQIAKARGYHHRWVSHVLSARAGHVGNR